MKYAALAVFSSSLGFLVLVLGHFRAQRKKQEELEENMAAALREEQHRRRAAEQHVVCTGSDITLLPTAIHTRERQK